MIEVLAPGPSATIQDLGRPGWSRWGVSPSGAADRPAHLLANRLVGNEAHAATIEVTLGGLAVTFHRAALIALAGAPCPVSVEGGPPVGHQAPTSLPAGSVVRLGRPAQGIRTYVAVRGGVDVAPVLGSRSTDSHGGIGPGKLQAGDLLPVGADPLQPIYVDVAPSRPPEWIIPIKLTTWPGPRSSPQVDELLSAVAFTVSHEINRVGVRLDGLLPAGIARPLDASEALIAGAVQLPPDSRPIVFLTDHPVTGGYPVVAVVDPDDLPLVAQLRPGVEVRFAPIARRDVAPIG